MSAGAAGRRSGVARVIFIAGLCLASLVFAGLGIWQLQRLSWKLDLIARTEERLRAAPVAAPGPADWPAITARADEYRRVTLQGRYLDAPETLTMAVTERGPGFWVLAPFRADAGFTVLVNRGFVPEDRRAPEERRKTAGSETKLVGLLRPSEPDGGFLRANDPGAGRWYSRDVTAIALARQLGPVAPYFVDADATAEPGPLPQGGMTQIAFRNAHLVYALIWFCLALMSAGAVAYLVRTGSDESQAD
ncbi:SURF1-like protein [Bosea sp. 62]|uniref:SURF1 family protein n=1 Tax=unclassified Bosea (in: a-proteobacteria) TaxID=2653178 RepID=UPI00125C18FB|nr:MULTISPECIES: SURF1 family protein [unclassified Bosea (in: a-proteobacteria)]CAD5249021.1 SURF1-like protein [Bosea sp. 46]CAD5250087.1 SURF1-like protein [Bosea sp. 21B]CAD5265735.1 SURF1-like protein [Bosea sp. 7B]VVT44595.1 SURF1-like protein [Bosea sp. EC-HK365B]VXB06497.1 SURF1-like protein [Bosea sp. 29B]